MNVLSLFDGMSCGQIALNRAGIKYDNYFACEIDKHAIKVTQHNYPNTIQLGDVTKVSAKDLPKIDLLIGGSPCQSISNLGKKDGLDGKSGLFFEYLRLLKEIQEYNPSVKFLLENEVGNRAASAKISELLGFDGILINSNSFTAQNRARYYWTNIEVSKIVPKDIVLKDVLDVDPDESCILTEGRFKWLTGNKGAECVKKRYAAIDPIKANCLTARSDASWNCNYVTREGDGLPKLTWSEYEKLQTVPVGYTSVVKTSERYKMLGNGWTVDVIAHIFKGLKPEENTLT